ncbi:hypothetical protein PIB30_023905 [Stylosanthes scabra]|uniref:Cyclic nucleotide-binding domain-containing protein n=1 Tax=Stylosanthes scabra TaxID=79078 RepID=A0ABU6U946_9FABA|nr:hypothetical protein [Stylosanthes scabra]
MAGFENDELPMLSEKDAEQYDETLNSKLQRFLSRTKSSIAIPMSTLESYDSETSLVGHTGPLMSERKTTPFVQMSGPLYATAGTGGHLQQRMVVTGRKEDERKTEKFDAFRSTGLNYWHNNKHDKENEHLMRSGQLGMCDDPYCTTCPTYFKASHYRNPKASTLFDPKFHNVLYGDAKGFARKFYSFCRSHVPGVINPHTKFIQRWNKILAIFCLVAIFVDPLFFFVFYAREDNNCIVINWSMTTTLVIVRSLNDLVYFFNILLQFRLAYVSPETRVVGTGDLEDHPKKIALHYIRGYFFLDLFVVFPLPQIMILFVLPKSLGGANYAKNLLRAAILVQYIPRLFRFLPMLIGQSPSGFIFESAWANFIINLLIFMLSGHVVGSCWYLFGLQRVNQCLRNACHNSKIPGCMAFIDCGHGHDGIFQLDQTSNQWNNNADANACLSPPSNGSGFAYGIYQNAVPLTTETNVINKYIYALFWGFQNFLQALGRRRLEMQLRGRDVEQWMSHRRLPENLRRRVRQAERYSWAATRGVNEEMLMEDLPEDLQRDIRRHLFKFIKKVRIFALMDEPILDAICERLRQRTYIKGSKILSMGGLVDKMVFVVRGKLESEGEDGIRLPLCEGDACGEELLTWYLEHSSVSTDGRKVRLPGQRLLSNRTVRCLTNVESFSLRAADLEEVTILFTRFLRSPRVQGALRYESPYWRSLAAIRIQVAWRYRKKRLNRADSKV